MLRHHRVGRLSLRHRSAVGAPRCLVHHILIWHCGAGHLYCSSTQVLIAVVVVVPYHPVPHSYYITIGFLSSSPSPLSFPLLSSSLLLFLSFLSSSHLLHTRWGHRCCACLWECYGSDSPLESPVPGSILLIPAPLEPIRHSSGSPLNSVHSTSVLTHLTEAASLMAAATVPAPQLQQGKSWKESSLEPT